MSGFANGSWFLLIDGPGVLRDESPEDEVINTEGNSAVVLAATAGALGREGTFGNTAGNAWEIRYGSFPMSGAGGVLMSVVFSNVRLPTMYRVHGHLGEMSRVAKVTSIALSIPYIPSGAWPGRDCLPEVWDSGSSFLLRCSLPLRLGSSANGTTDLGGVEVVRVVRRVRIPRVCDRCGRLFFRGCRVDFPSFGSA